MPPRYDNVLLVGYGGPTDGACHCDEPACPGGAYCFVRAIVGNGPSSAERIAEVTAHYEALGGTSPFNRLTLEQAGALHRALAARGLDLPVRLGTRHWAPFVQETVREIAAAGGRRTLGLILAPHQSKASWDDYQQCVSQAVRAAGPNAPAVDYLDPWFDRPGFLAAAADRIRSQARKMGAERFHNAALIFSAHSIPVAASGRSPYVAQFQATAAGVARIVGKETYLEAYQSQPSNPSIPWLGPDVCEVVRQAAAGGARDVVLSPIGFLCDHVEVLYDLDVEARQAAAESGVTYWRAGTVGSHPEFIGMLADLIRERCEA